MADEIGSAVVRIEADTEDLDQTVVRDLEEAAQEAGDSMERTLSESFDDVSQIADDSAQDVGRAFDETAEGVEGAFDDAATGAADSFTQVEDAATDVGEVAAESADHVGEAFTEAGDDVVNVFTEAAAESDAALSDIGAGAGADIVAEFEGAGADIAAEFEGASADASAALDDIGGSADNVVGSLGDIGDAGEGALGALAGGAAGASSALEGLLGPILAIGTAIGVGGATLAAQRLNSALAVTETLLARAGEASNLTLERLRTIAQERSRALGVDVTDLLEASNIALAFGINTEDALLKVIGASADLSAIMGRALPRTMRILAAALADPTRGVTQLQTQIGGITDETVDAVTNLQEMGDTAGAQALLFNALEDAVGGAAEASADSTAIIGAAFSELVKDFGQPFIQFLDDMTPTILAAMDGLRDLISPVLEDFAQSLRNITEELVDLDTGIFKVRSLGEALEVVFEEFNLDDIDLRGQVSGFVGNLINDLIEAFEAMPVEQIANVFVRSMIRMVAVVAEEASFIVAELVPAIVKALPDIVIGIGEGLVEAARDNPIEIGALVVALGLVPAKIAGGIAAAFGAIPIVGGVGKIILNGFAALGRLVVPTFVQTAVQSVPAALRGFGTAIVRALVGIIPAAITGAGAAALGAAVALGALLGVALNRAVEALVPEVNDALEAVGGAIFDFFVALPGVVVGALQAFGGFLVDFFTELPTRLLAAARALPTLLADLAVRSLGSMLGGLGTAVVAVIDFFRRLPTRIREQLAGLPRQLFDRALGALASMANGLASGVGAIIGFFAALPGRILGALAGLAQGLLNVATSAMGSMASGLASGATGVLGFMAELPGRIAGALGNLGSILVQKGRDLIEGFIRGIRQMPGRVRDALVGLLPGPLRKFASVLGLASPSTLFEGFGRDLVQGLVVGIENQEDALLRALRDIAEDVGRVSEEGFVVAAPGIEAETLPVPAGTSESWRRRLDAARGARARALTVDDLERLVRLVLDRSRDVTVNEVADDPIATARKVAFELGRESIR